MPIEDTKDGDERSKIFLVELRDKSLEVELKQKAMVGSALHG